jgi:hypothetical protein
MYCSKLQNNLSTNQVLNVLVGAYSYTGDSSVVMCLMCIRELSESWPGEERLKSLNFRVDSMNYVFMFYYSYL